jgi:hypothetical protein
MICGTVSTKIVKVGERFHYAKREAACSHRAAANLIRKIISEIRVEVHLVRGFDTGLRFK